MDRADVVVCVRDARGMKRGIAAVGLSAVVKAETEAPDRRVPMAASWTFVMFIDVPVPVNGIMCLRCAGCMVVVVYGVVILGSRVASKHPKVPPTIS